MVRLGSKGICLCQKFARRGIGLAEEKTDVDPRKSLGRGRTIAKNIEKNRLYSRENGSKNQPGVGPGGKT